MASLPNPPNVTIKLHHPVREELSEKQQELIDKNATISPEAMLLLQEFQNTEIETLANIEYDPKNPAIYGQWAYHHKARIAVLSQLIQIFTGKVR